MRIAAVSDLHGNLPNIPECDLLVIAGDICPDRYGGKWARTVPAGQKMWLDKELLPWLNRQPVSRTVATWGNHDFIGQAEDLNHTGVMVPYIEILVDTALEIEGLSFWFSPWTPQNDLPSRWAFMREDNDLSRKFDTIPAGTDVLVSHGPPKGYGDGLPGVHDDDCPLRYHPFTGTASMCTCGNMASLGSRMLLQAIHRVRPSTVICGHIHAGYGQCRLEHAGYNDTMIYNVALVDEGYRAVNPITIIDL